MIAVVITVFVYILGALFSATPWNNVELRFGANEHYGGRCEHRDVELTACSPRRCLVIYESDPVPCSLSKGKIR